GTRETLLFPRWVHPDAELCRCVEREQRKKRDRTLGTPITHGYRAIPQHARAGFPLGGSLGPRLHFAADINHLVRMTLTLKQADELLQFGFVEVGDGPERHL